MALSTGVVRASLLAVIMTAVVGLGLALAPTAHAQVTLPFTVYGGGLTEGDTVEALIDGNSCGSATVDSNGEWGPISINVGDCNDAAADGSTVMFYLNGEAADQTETFSQAGAPADPVNGVSLTVSEGGGEVTPPDTGNAGLVSTSGGAASWLALALGAFALASVGVARTATRRAQ